MEEREPQETEEPKAREPLFNKTTIIIVVAFLVLNLAFIGVLFGAKFFGSKTAEGEGAGISTCPLDEICIVDLGRIEVTKPLDPMQQNFSRYLVSVALVVPIDRQQETETRVRQFDAIFKEEARNAFLEADQQDLAAQNLAGVKNAIRRRINEQLGEDVVQEVRFPDYKIY